MYRYREDVIAFTEFAHREINNLPAKKVKANENNEQNLHVLSSVNFERILIAKQTQLLDQVMNEAASFFLSFSHYLNELRWQLTKTYLEARIPPVI